MAKLILPGIKSVKGKIGSHPPKNNNAVNKLIKIM